MRIISWLVALFLFAAGALTSADAMPNFSRKLGVGCATCHTTIPALNRTGYKFRAAGFRMPADIGKEEDKKFDLGDSFAARIQQRYDTQVTNQPNGAAITNCPGGVCGPRTTTNAFSFFEATLYPLTGSWGKYFASESELSVSPEDVFEVENAYVRFVKGNDSHFFTARMGVFHPWGASARRIVRTQTGGRCSRAHRFWREAAPSRTCSSPGAWTKQALRSVATSRTCHCGRRSWAAR